VTDENAYLGEAVNDEKNVGEEKNNIQCLTVNNHHRTFE
jgi:hypothetical protein